MSSTTHLVAHFIVHFVSEKSTDRQSGRLSERLSGKLPGFSRLRRDHGALKRKNRCVVLVAGRVIWNDPSLLCGSVVIRCQSASGASMDARSGRYSGAQPGQERRI